VPDRPPRYFIWRRATHTVVRAEGPERIAMEWWRSQGTRPTRDYFRVEDEAGLRFWLYRDGLYNEAAGNDDAVPPKWFLHGLFA
jgi:protein ImuB